MPNKTMTFAVDIVPAQGATFHLGTDQAAWILPEGQGGGTGDTSTKTITFNIGVSDWDEENDGYSYEIEDEFVDANTSAWFSFTYNSYYNLTSTLTAESSNGTLTLTTPTIPANRVRGNILLVKTPADDNNE